MEHFEPSSQNIIFFICISYECIYVYSPKYLASLFHHFCSKWPIKQDLLNLQKYEYSKPNSIEKESFY